MIFCAVPWDVLCPGFFHVVLCFPKGSLGPCFDPSKPPLEKLPGRDGDFIQLFNATKLDRRHHDVGRRFFRGGKWRRQKALGVSGSFIRPSLGVSIHNYVTLRDRGVLFCFSYWYQVCLYLLMCLVKMRGKALRRTCLPVFALDMFQL